MEALVKWTFVIMVIGGTLLLLLVAWAGKDPWPNDPEEHPKRDKHFHL